jgi:ABC-2 type transport system permease protein
MIIKIASKEFKEIVREGRFRVTAAIVLILLAISVVASKAYYESINEQHERAKHNTRQMWEGQGTKNPHSAAHYGTYAFKPKYPLSLIDQGVDKYAGSSIYLEAHHRNESQNMAAQDQTALSRFGELTPDFLLLFIIPFIIILIGFNSFSGERERGTMRLLNSLGVPSWKLAVGKWLGIFMPVMLLVLPIYLLAAFLLSGIIDYGQFSLGGLSLLFVFYLVFYAIITNLTLIVSAVSKKSSLAFISLLAVWIVGCLAIPKLATGLAQELYPYPSQTEFEAQLAADKAQGANIEVSWDEQSKQIANEMLKKYGVDSVSQLPINLDGLLMQKGEELDAELWFKHYDLLRQTQQRQENVYQAMSLTSPFLPARFLSMAVCRTDYDSHWDFADAAERYRLMVMDRMNSDLMNNSRTGQWDYMASDSLWASVPEFEYEPRGYAAVMQDNFGHLSVLAIWLFGSFLLLVGVVKSIKPV